MRAVIDKILLIPEVGDVVNLKDITVELSVYQNLFDHYMYCDITVTDSFDLSQLIPQDVENWVAGGFAGTEMLLIQYYPDGGTGPLVSNVFFLYERSAKKPVNNNMDAYTLNGVSVESFNAFAKRISRAYGPNRIDKMIQSITNEFLYNQEVRDLYNSVKTKTGTLIDKNNTYEETVGTQEYIIPNLGVDDTIEFLSNESDSQSHIPQYLFYETNNGFNFRNLESLVSQPVKLSFTKEESVTRANSLKKPYNKIVGFEVISESNILEKARDGLFKSKVIAIDMLKKSKIETEYRYNTANKKFKTLQKFQHRGNVPSSDVNVTMMTTRRGHDNDLNFTNEVPYPKRIDHFISARKSYTKHIFNTTLRVTVPGTTELNVGDVIYLDFPINDGLTDDISPKSDIQLTGKYIVTKLRNKMNNPASASSYQTIIECVKDSQIEIT